MDSLIFSRSLNAKMECLFHDAGEVIEGWEIGLQGMKQGGIRHIIVPPKAGYGTKDIGAGVGATLYFEVTLLKC